MAAAGSASVRANAPYVRYVAAGRPRLELALIGYVVDGMEACPWRLREGNTAYAGAKRSPTVGVDGGVFFVASRAAAPRTMSAPLPCTGLSLPPGYPAYMPMMLPFGGPPPGMSFHWAQPHAATPGLAGFGLDFSPAAATNQSVGVAFPACAPPLPANPSPGHWMSMPTTSQRSEDRREGGSGTSTDGSCPPAAVGVKTTLSQPVTEEHYGLSTAPIQDAGDADEAPPSDHDVADSVVESVEGGRRRASRAATELRRSKPKHAAAFGYIKAVEPLDVADGKVVRPPPHTRVSYSRAGAPQYKCRYCDYVSDSYVVAGVGLTRPQGCV